MGMKKMYEMSKSTTNINSIRENELKPMFMKTGAGIPRSSSLLHFVYFIYAILITLSVFISFEFRSQRSRLHNVNWWTREKDAFVVFRLIFVLFLSLFLLNKNATCVFLFSFRLPSQVDPYRRKIKMKKYHWHFSGTTCVVIYCYKIFCRQPIHFRWNRFVSILSSACFYLYFFY